jgi:hypothetical protein
VKRLVGTGAGLIFKGSGFYTTDYRSASYKEGAKKEAPVTAGPGSDKSAGAQEATTKTSAGSTSVAEKKPKKEAA